MRAKIPILIGVVGGSGAGKSWLADKLQNAIGPQAGRLSLDDFYLDRSHLSSARRTRINFDHPRAVDWVVFERALLALRNGKSAKVPCYDFSTHSCARHAKMTKSSPLIIIDGLWLFRPLRIRSLFDLKVFMDCSARTRLRRRIKRDTAARGRTSVSVSRQFWETVEPMHRKFVQGQANRADVVITEACPETEINALIASVKRILRESEMALT
jgi:uridine kinase